LIYNEKYKKQREIKFNNERYTYLQWGYRKNKMDIKKIKTSIKANYIHSIDACLVRWAAGRTKIKAVHDCYYIDYINLTYLTSLLNEGMRVRFHQIEDFGEISIFSIFICI
jgi:DNA-directed RNA polymerase